MEMMKLNINLLPRGAWNNDFSSTLKKSDWDKIRKKCYEKAHGRCQICGRETNELDAHEVWRFDCHSRTQTLVKIIAVCTKCHGVIHFKNTVRLGYGEKAKEHFIRVNNCSELDFVANLYEAVINYNELNKVYRWKIVADLEALLGENVNIKTDTIPFIKNPYDKVDWKNINLYGIKNLFDIFTNGEGYGLPAVIELVVDNYQGMIEIKAYFVNKIE